NQAAPTVGFSKTQFGRSSHLIMRQADVEISDVQIGRSVKLNRSVKPGSPNPEKASSQAIDVSKAKNGNATYVQLMSHTMESLLSEMRKECTQHGSKFAVVFIPSRAQLSPTPGMEKDFFGITYADEIRLISRGCAAEQIPVFNGECAVERIAPE